MENVKNYATFTFTSSKRFKKILNKMNRNHTIDEYLEIIEKLKKRKSIYEIF